MGETAVELHTAHLQFLSYAHIPERTRKKDFSRLAKTLFRQNPLLLHPSFVQFSFWDYSAACGHIRTGHTKFHLVSRSGIVRSEYRFAFTVFVARTAILPHLYLVPV